MSSHLFLQLCPALAGPGVVTLSCMHLRYSFRCVLKAPKVGVEAVVHPIDDMSHIFHYRPERNHEEPIPIGKQRSIKDVPRPYAILERNLLFGYLNVVLNYSYLLAERYSGDDRVLRVPDKHDNGDAPLTGLHSIGGHVGVVGNLDWFRLRMLDGSYGKAIS